MEIIDESLIWWDISVVNAEDLLKIISKKLIDMKIINNEDEFKSSFKERENKSSTYLSNKIALPHVQGHCVNTECIVILKLNSTIKWTNNEEVKIIILFVVKKENMERERMLKIIEFIEKLAEECFIEKISKASNKNEFIKIIR